MPRSLFAVIGACALTLMTLPALAQGVPAGSTCAQPDVAAKVITAAPPVLPDDVRAAGISGTVTVLIALDEGSHITSAAILESPSPRLNGPALLAARSSTFQTRIRACKPIAEPFRYFVTFGIGGAPAAPTGTPPSISDDFLGTWYCGNEIKSRIVKAYGLTANNTTLSLDNNYITADNVISLSREAYTEANAVLTLRSFGDGESFTGTSPGWAGDHLIFTGIGVRPPSGDGTTPLPPSTRRLSYARADADHFTRTLDWIPPNQTAWSILSRETCARIAKPGL